MGYPSKKEKALEVAKLYKGGGRAELEKLCNDHNISMNVYYKWNSPRMKKKEAKGKPGRRKRAVSEFPSIPTSFIPPTIVANPSCPPGYVMIMVPKASLSSLFGGES